jgi:hypothetical protein
MGAHWGPSIHESFWFPRLIRKEKMQIFNFSIFRFSDFWLFAHVVGLTGLSQIAPYNQLLGTPIWFPTLNFLFLNSQNGKEIWPPIEIFHAWHLGTKPPESKLEIEPPERNFLQKQIETSTTPPFLNIFSIAPHFRAQETRKIHDFCENLHFSHFWQFFELFTTFSQLPRIRKVFHH